MEGADVVRRECGHDTDSMRKGGGVGALVLLIAAAIVMILAMRSWLAVAPAAVEVLNPPPPGKTAHRKPKAPPAGVADHGDPNAKAALADLPDLQDMKSGTDKHAKEVQKALEETDR